MKTPNFYFELSQKSIAGDILEKNIADTILTSREVELLPLLNSAYQVRQQFCGNEVKIHIINNAQNGHCAEDCHYCAQAKSSTADIEEYPLKPEAEILAEAKRAYESGAYRYCMVFAGRGPSERRVEHLAQLIRKIKAQYPIKICVSTGLLDAKKAQILKDAGLDRLNHNLNTSRRHYPKICTTHTYEDRLKTLHAATIAGIEICSGVIAGMGEQHEDIIEVAYTLRELNSPSIPVNFFIPIPGNRLTHSDLTPEYCLRILCLYRFLNPKAEIRVAAGREIHLRSMEVMALYPANSLFMDGYLNTKGTDQKRTLQMIKDAGFTINSEKNLDDLLEEDNKKSLDQVVLKDLYDLRPHFQPQENTI